MSLLREIQSDAVDKNVDISVLLRKCKILAARLGNEEFKLWVERELNGYTSKEDVPGYRILKAESYGYFAGIAGSALKNAPIPLSYISGISKEWKEFITTLYLMNPISYFTSFTKNRSGNDVLKIDWPADLIAYVGDKIYEGMNCMSAWRIISCSSIFSLLDTVRNRILSFALEIEAEAPDAGEAEPNIKPLADERVSQVFNTYIMGNVANLATGSQNVAQSTQITVFQNDLDSLKQYLASLGIHEPDLKKLEQAIHEDAQSGVKGDLGSKVKAWMGKMINKAGTSTWNVAVSVAAILLAEALKKYYGL